MTESGSTYAASITSPHVHASAVDHRYVAVHSSVRLPRAPFFEYAARLRRHSIFPSRAGRCLLSIECQFTPLVWGPRRSTAVRPSEVRLFLHVSQGRLAIAKIALDCGDNLLLLVAQC